MPTPLLPLPRTASPHAVAIAARARLSAATAAGGALLAAATLLLTPRPAHASDLYAMCLDAVHGMALRCLDTADSLLGNLACMWLGGAGYITCAVLEALRQLIPGGLNAT